MKDNNTWADEQHGAADCDCDDAHCQTCHPDLERRAFPENHESPYRVTVDAAALERVLAFLEDDSSGLAETLQDQIDDDEQLRCAVDVLAGRLSEYANNNPAFDERE